MYRPSYGVVSGVVTALVCLAFVTKLMQAAIPDPPVGRFLKNETAAYLVAGARQKIEWHPLEQGIFAEARRREMPILLVVGAPWSKYARDMDSGVFSDLRVQNYLARNFLCVRVDSLQMPEWRNAFLPISRARPASPILPGFTAWTLDSTGEMFDLYARTASNQGADPQVFLSFLVQARIAFDRLSPETIGDTPGGSLEKADREAIDLAGNALPDFSKHLQSVLGAIDTNYGGIPIRGLQVVQPSCWRYLLLSGQIAAFHRSADPALTSPIVDLLDGGFFSACESPDWRGVNYGKVAVANADMLRTLCLAERLTGDPFYRRLGVATFDSLTGEFHQNDTIMGCRLGDEESVNRSRRTSFSPRRLREIFPEAADREWIRKELGLRTETNPQMSVYLADRNVAADQRAKYDQVMAKLREASKSHPNRFAGESELDVNGFVIARLIEAARNWGDNERLKTALSLFTDLGPYRAANDVVHSLGADRRGDASLTDYLAYADAALAMYLATRDIATLDYGKEVLRRGLYLFKGSRLGLFKMSNSDPGIPTNGDEAPEIVDSTEESCTAQLVRLSQNYSRIYLGTDPAAVSELSAAANTATNLFAPIAGEMGPAVSGFFCAASRMQDSAFLVTTGPNAQSLADDLVRRYPSRMVVPAVGKIRTDLQARGAGVYIVRDGSIEGPMASSQVLAKLSPTLQLDLRKQ